MSRHLDRREIDGFDQLEGPARKAAIEHARSCEACRSELASGDPSRLFSLLPALPVPVEILDQVSAGVAAQLRARRARRRWAAGAVAAALVLAGLLGVYLHRTPFADPAPGAVVTAPPVFVTSEAPRAEVELLSSPGTAQVFDLTMGDTQVVMILDERLEL